MANNVSTSSRTKHIDTRAKFVNELVGNLIEIEYINTKDNLADWFTKNVPSDVVERHSPAFLGEVERDNEMNIDTLDSESS